MTEQEYKRHTADFFRGKEAVIVETCRCGVGTLEKGDTVIISDKYKGFYDGFYITSKKLIIPIIVVRYEDLELMESKPVS